MKARALKMHATAEVLRLDAFLALRKDAKKPRAPRKTKPVAERFAALVDSSAGLEACHPFKGALGQHDGYGQIWDINPKTGKPTMRLAHIVAWELYNGARVPDGEHVLHARGCPKHCCNGRHLRLGDRFDNMADAKAEKRLKSRKLNAAKAIEICTRFDAGEKIPVLARMYGVSVQAIWQCVTGKTWSRATGRAETYVPRKTGRPRKAQATAKAA